MNEPFATEPDEDDRCHLCRAINGYDDLPLKAECPNCSVYISKRKRDAESNKARKS